MSSTNAFCKGFGFSLAIICALVGLGWALAALSVVWHPVQSTEWAVTIGPFNRQLLDVQEAGLHVSKSILNIFGLWNPIVRMLNILNIKRFRCWVGCLSRWKPGSL